MGEHEVLGPVGTVEGAVLDGFGDVFGVEVGGVFDVGDGAGSRRKPTTKRRQRSWRAPGTSFGFSSDPLIVFDFDSGRVLDC